MLLSKKAFPRYGLGTAVTAVLLFAHTSLWSQGIRKNELTVPITDPVTIDIQVQQSEVSVHSKQTNKFTWWFWGGVIGLVAAHNVDKTRGKQAGQLVNELHELLNTFDFKPSLAQRLEGGINPHIIPILGEIRFQPARSDLHLPESTTVPPQDMLSIHYGYGLVDEFQTLQVTLKAAVWNPGTQASLENLSEDQARSQARYFQVFTYELTPETIAALKDPKQRAGGWLDLGKDQMQTLILSGMTTLTDALSYDLGSPGMEAELRQATDAGLNGVARLIHESGAQRWIRADSGELTILEVH